MIGIAGDGSLGNATGLPLSNSQQVVDAEEGTRRRDPVADHRHGPVRPEPQAMQLSLIHI